MPHPTDETMIPGSFDAADKPLDAPSNRRTDGRGHLRLELIVTLLAHSAQPQMRIDTKDITSTGMGFISRRYFPVNEYFAVLMRFANGPGKLILCRTAFCRPAKPGMHHTGAEFIQAITPTASGKFPPRWIELATAKITARE
jgi:hypothetical protein